MWCLCLSGLEGAESAIPILGAILEAAADHDLDGAVIGMPHRGRLNVLTNIVGKSYDQIFKEFEGQVDPDSMQGSGDRSEEHTSELQSLMRISYAVFCLKKKTERTKHNKKK